MNKHYIREDEFYVPQPMPRAQRWAIGFFAICFVLALGMSIASAQAACVVGGPDACFSSSAAPGPAPLSTTLTWNVPSATACTAGGAGSVAAWTGSVPKSGTRTLTGINVDMTLTLACTGTGKVKLDWVPPTTNTDGTPVALAGYTVLYGVSPTTLVSTVQVNVPTATSYTVDLLAAGSWAFAVRARNTAGAESVNSNVITKAVLGYTFNGSQLVDVTAVPSSPTGLVVTEVTAKLISANPDGSLVAADFPLVPLGISCAGMQCTVLARRAP